MDYSKFEALAAATIELCSVLADTSDLASIYTHTVSVLEANIEFQELLDQLALHQDNVLRIKALSNEAIILNNQLDQYMHRLLDARKQLNEAVLGDDTPGSQSTIPHTMLLNYAAKISKFSSAPDGYDTTNNLYKNLPAYFPWPSEDAMRKGVLMAPQAQTDFSGTAPSTSPTEIDHSGFSDNKLPTQPISPSKKQYTNVFDGLDLYEPKDSDEINI
ncbi:hypothetical protein PORY_002365 [Pneumocystis oryctolagi]|uniref:Uncharacterized protein n=1 Tax=Pneumocystis oryctolagi TaxID=42067 RepID=A0ACB7CBI6_9ASCO|nr:hypothetical protein PORY_002365 [Pneumocystis oryctolagi]